MGVEVTILAVAGNALNLAYNIPLVWHVLETGSANDISTYFLTLRISGSICWLVYAMLTKDIWILISYLVTLTSSVITLVVKCRGSCFARPIHDKSQQENAEIAHVTYV